MLKFPMYTHLLLVKFILAHQFAAEVNYTCAGESVDYTDVNGGLFDS